MQGSRFEGSNKPGRANDIDIAKPLQNMIADVCLGSSSKMSLLKMQVVRADEFLQYFQRMRQFLAEGLVIEADQIMATLEE